MRVVGSTVSSTELRARFALGLSALYGREVPAYTTLVEVAQEVNERVLRRSPDAERLGSIARVTAERHGAIRVGGPREMSQVARIFGAFGMYPTGFYDLRDAAPTPIPVISTAFRPLAADELAANPFRVFTSMLVPEDRKFFSAELERRLSAFIEARTLFGEELLELADRAEADGGLGSTDADRFLELATASFALSPEPVDQRWYSELEEVSGVAADIGGVTSTHINHLTPRVLDIDDLYASMQARGVEMIEAIQGPPKLAGPGVLLRQTSFKALAEPRTFRQPDGTLTEGSLRIRFGEVEARGVALTPAGRELYDRLVREVDEQTRADPDADPSQLAGRIWGEGMPASEHELRIQGLAFFRYRVSEQLPQGPPPDSLDELVRHGWVVAEPIVYEDFLPRSAAGIFSSNLTGAGAMDAAQGGAERDETWLAAAIGREVHDPAQTYADQSAVSLATVQEHLTALRAIRG